MANADKSCDVDFFYADYLFRSGQYQESLNKAKAMENGTCRDYWSLKLLYAYNYDRLGDTIQARDNIMSFMNSAPKDKVLGEHYIFAANALKKVAGSENDAINFLNKALESDTVRLNRVQYMDTIAALYKKQGRHDQRIEWLRRSYNLNPKPSDFDLYNWTDAAISARNYTLADSLAGVYIQKRPDQEYGYSLRVRAAKASDRDSTGAAFTAVDEYINFLSKDPEKNKAKMLNQYYYMASVASDKMKDYPKAISILERILLVDPQNTFATQALPVLRNAVNRPTQSAKPAPKTTPAKPAPTKAPAKATTTTKKKS
jgi:tetratricopeptide (TPR) repeat protein